MSAPRSTHDTGAPDERTWSLEELTVEADVTARTVRYYIAEGLLPPPLTPGRNARYTSDHLARLRMIAKMKEAFLPLKEIRRRLASMSDDDIALIATADEPAIAEDAAPRIMSAPMPAMMEPPPLAMEAPPRIAKRAMIREDNDIHDYVRRALDESPDRHRPSRPAPAPRYRRVDPARDPWLRIPISDDAELVIRYDTFVRREAQFSAALDWIRRILNES